MTEQKFTYHEILAMRGIFDKEDICGDCEGLGIKSYPNTATYMRGSGISGQAFTDDICDKCWGSGNINRPFRDLRKAFMCR